MAKRVELFGKMACNRSEASGEHPKHAFHDGLGGPAGFGILGLQIESIFETLETESIQVSCNKVRYSIYGRGKVISIVPFKNCVIEFKDLQHHEKVC